MDKIALVGLEFHGFHGVHAEEAKLGARFVVDVEIGLDLSGIGDELGKTVDYGEVYELVKETLSAHRFYLIEALAGRIAERLWERFPLIQVLTVRVHKPHAPLRGVFRDVYAEVERRR